MLPFSLAFWLLQRCLRALLLYGNEPRTGDRWRECHGHLFLILTVSIVCSFNGPACRKKIAEALIKAVSLHQQLGQCKKKKKLLFAQKRNNVYNKKKKVSSSSSDTTCKIPFLILSQWNHPSKDVHGLHCSDKWTQEYDFKEQLKRNYAATALTASWMVMWLCQVSWGTGWRSLHGMWNNMDEIWDIPYIDAVNRKWGTAYHSSACWNIAMDRWKMGRQERQSHTGRCDRRGSVFIIKGRQSHFWSVSHYC